MNTHFIKLEEPTIDLIEQINRWDNDPTLIPLVRPNRNKTEFEKRYKMTIEDLTKRLESHHIYLIYLNDKVVGEMNFMVDPGHLFNKVPGTAWIGITIGEPEGRGKGIGKEAIEYLEEQIKKQGLKRIELGVFEFNTPAQNLYKKMGYKEIGCIENFTYWNEQMWTDIRMEKYL